MSSQAQHGLESFIVPVMLHQPARRLGTEKDASAKDEGWNKCGTELETPGDILHVLDNNIGGEAQENTCIED